MKTPYEVPTRAPDGGRPLKGDRWLSVNGMALSSDEPVTVGCSAYAAGERISHAFDTSIPELLLPGANLFTDSSMVKISVTNMPPVLAARILSLETAIIAIIRHGADPSILVEAWEHIDQKAKKEAAEVGA